MKTTSPTDLRFPRDPPAMRRRIKGMLMAGKQYSLDSRMDLVTTLVSSARPGENMPTMRENSVEMQDFQEQGVDTGEGVAGVHMRVKDFAGKC